jgi:hypothetical protein
MPTIPLSLLQFPGQFFDANGDPLNGGKLQFFSAGTVTPEPVYADVNGSATLTNPVVLDTSGYAQIFLSPTLYDVVVMDSLSVELYTVLGVGDPGQITAASLGTTQAEGATGVTLPYTVLSSDNTITIALASGAGALQLPAASVRSSANLGNGWSLLVFNFSANACAITPTGADTINGNNAALSLAAGKCAQLWSNGTSKWTVMIGTTS